MYDGDISLRVKVLRWKLEVKHEAIAWKLEWKTECNKFRSECRKKCIHKTIGQAGIDDD